jgi:hypothetical protein
VAGARSTSRSRGREAAARGRARRPWRRRGRRDALARHQPVPAPALVEEPRAWPGRRRRFRRRVDAPGTTDASTTCHRLARPATARPTHAALRADLLRCRKIRGSRSTFSAILNSAKCGEPASSSTDAFVAWSARWRIGRAWPRRREARSVADGSTRPGTVDVFHRAMPTRPRAPATPTDAARRRRRLCAATDSRLTRDTSAILNSAKYVEAAAHLRGWRGAPPGPPGAAAGRPPRASHAARRLRRPTPARPAATPPADPYPRASARSRSRRRRGTSCARRAWSSP